MSNFGLNCLNWSEDKESTLISGRPNYCLLASFTWSSTTRRKEFRDAKLNLDWKGTQIAYCGSRWELLRKWWTTNMLMTVKLRRQSSIIEHLNYKNLSKSFRWIASLNNVWIKSIWLCNIKPSNLSEKPVFRS